MTDREYHKKLTELRAVTEKVIAKYNWWKKFSMYVSLVQLLISMWGLAGWYVQRENYRTTAQAYELSIFTIRHSFDNIFRQNQLSQKRMDAALAKCNEIK